MVEHRDSDRWIDTPVRRDRGSLGGSDFALVFTGVAFGAAAGAAVAYYFLAGESGDEPPIRVRGGSSEFELLDPSIYWVDEGSKKKWRLSGGTKNSDEYKVVVRILKGDEQTFYGSKISVYVGANDKVVELKANNKKTKLSSDDALDYKGNNQQVLTHPLGISKIKLDGDAIYEPSAGTLEEVLIYDK